MKGKDTMFSFLKTRNSSSYTPSGSKSWISKMVSEFLGTAFLTWMIGLLGVTFGGVKFETLMSNEITPAASHLVIGFWVALDVLICLAVFARWSCDLNPAVTAYRMLDKKNSFKYGFAKIGMQILGGLLAGLLIWGTQEISHAVSNMATDASTSANNSWSAFRPIKLTSIAHGHSAWRHIIALIGEFLGGLILLWPIMTKEIKSPVVKDIVLLLCVGFGVAALLELGTVGWNPARTLGTNYIFDVIKGGTDSMQLYWAYALGPILSAFALYYGQKTTKFLNHKWESWLEKGKFKDIEVKKDPKEESKK